jgi:sugar-phosphatase
MPDSPTPGAAFAGRTFDAVLFDMDGTLIDSVPAVDRSWKRWAAEQGFPDAEDFQIQHGTPARALIARLLPPERVDAAYDNEGVTILPGTRDALAALPDERRAVVTSCTAPLAAARMAASGLEAPRVLVTADDVAHGKPAPDPFLLGAERLGVDPARCLVVEDAPAGIASARAAGCAVLAVTGTHSAAELAAASPAPDAVAAGLAAVRLAGGPGGVRGTDA